jgi:outer membrane protein assembly factor BamB
MKKVCFSIGSFVVIVLLTSVINASAQDYPQWRGVNRDGNVTGFKAPEVWPKELKQEWKITVGLGDAAPVLMGRKLYSFTRQGMDEILLCLDAGSGKEIWQDKYASCVVGGPSAVAHQGPRSTPTIAEGKVVTLGVCGVLSCLDASSGKVLWRKENTSNLFPAFYTASSPIILDGICIAQLGGKDNGTTIAFDLATGTEKWKYTGDGPTYSSPVIMTVEGKKQLVAYTEKSLIGLSLDDGKLLWKVDALAQNRFYNSATPVIDGQTVIVTGQGTGTRAIKIEKQGEEYVPKELWNNPDLGTKYNTPVIKDGFLYGLSNGRKLYCMDAAKGLTMWTDTTMNSDFGSLINCGSVLMTLPSNSNLIVFNPSEKAYTQLTKIKVSDKPIFTTPLVAGNRIFIKEAETLTLYHIN